MTEMETREKAREELLNKIRSLQAKERGFFRNLFSGRKPEFTSTATYCSGFQKEFGTSVTFYRSKVTRRVVTIGFPVLATLLIYHWMDHHQLLVWVLAHCVIYAPLLYYFWWSNNYPEVIFIDHTGIKINGLLYKWDSVLTTHIKEVPEGEGEKHFLTLGRTSGELVDLDLSPYAFTQKYFSSREKQLVILSAAIEYFKQLPGADIEFMTIPDHED